MSLESEAKNDTNYGSVKINTTAKYFYQVMYRREYYEHSCFLLFSGLTVSFASAYSGTFHHQLEWLHINLLDAF